MFINFPLFSCLYPEVVQSLHFTCHSCSVDWFSLWRMDFIPIDTLWKCWATLLSTHTCHAGPQLFPSAELLPTCPHCQPSCPGQASSRCQVPPTHMHIHSPQPSGHYLCTGIQISSHSLFEDWSYLPLHLKCLTPKHYVLNSNEIYIF